MVAGYRRGWHQSEQLIAVLDRGGHIGSSKWNSVDRQQRLRWYVTL
jgi:hypothetical protein